MTSDGADQTTQNGGFFFGSRVNNLLRGLIGRRVNNQNNQIWGNPYGSAPSTYGDSDDYIPSNVWNPIAGGPSGWGYWGGNRGAGGEDPFLGEAPTKETDKYQKDAYWKAWAALQSGRLNDIGKINPYQQTYFTGTPGEADYTEHTVLHPAEQEALNQRRGITQGLLGGAAGYLVPQALEGIRNPLDFSDLPGGQEFNYSGMPSIRDFNAEGMPQVGGFSYEDLPELSSGRDLLTASEPLEQATYQRGRSLLEPGFDRNRQALEVSLANRGIASGSSQYNDELGRLDQEQNRAWENLALSSVGAGRQEQSRLFGLQHAARGLLGGEQLSAHNQNMALRGLLGGEQLQARGQDLAQRQLYGNEQTQRWQMNQELRNQRVREMIMGRTQPINELAAILGQTPVQNMMQPSQRASYGMQAPDVLGYEAQAEQARAARRSSSSNFFGTVIGGLLGGYFSSDRRLKEDIRPVGKAENGLTIYSFKYKGSDTETLGLMADEVEKLHPEAVGTDADGYKFVDYGRAVL